MDLNGGKPLSPWKVPSKISLKRIQHKINSDLTIQSHSSSSNLDKTTTKNNVKRNRFVANKFALSRSISTPTPNENLTQTTTITTTDEHLLAKLQQIMPQQQQQQQQQLQHVQQMNSAIKSFSFEQTFSSQLTNKFPDEIVETFPIDWSLKTSCRFYCSDNSPFLFNYQKLRSQDESIAIEYAFSNGIKENSKAFFRSLTSYWIYPHISWLKLFPRSNNQNNSNVSPLDEQSQLAIQNEWKISFQSLFQLFRTKSCPYFYFCANSFNILFREDEISQFVAIIHPTTSGFRSTLEKEGILFTIINENDATINKIDQQEQEEGENHGDDNDDENLDENDATCEQWLEDMGLRNPSTINSNNDKQFLQTKQKTFNENCSKTILIKEISSVNSLFNYLLNKSERISISLTGPLTGIPPTLISPSPFVNSTFKYLNVHFQSNSIVTIDGGPILPSKMKQLWNLFTNENHSIQMLCHHLEKTSAFNYDQHLFKTIKHISINQLKQLRVQFTSI